MLSTVESLDNNLQRLTVTIDPATFTEELEEAFKRNRSRFQIPGFRKGKAPMTVVTHYYGESVLYEDVLDHLIQPTYQEAVKENKLEPFSHPEVDIKSIGTDEGLVLEYEFAVKPPVTLGSVDGIEAYRPKVDVSEERVDELLKRDQLRASRLVPADDRPVQKDDLVTIDYKGTVDGVAFAGGSAEGYELKIGSNTFIPGFEDQIIGHSKDESFDVNVTFPEEYHAEELKGKAAVFAVTIHEIKAREMPEIDDEFIKDISDEYDTVADYRKYLKETEEKTQEDHAQREFSKNVVKAFVDRASVELPKLAVDDEIQELMEEQKERMAGQGLRFEQYLQYMGLTEEVYAQYLKQPAEESLKEKLVLGALAEKENITVSDEKVDKRVEDLAKVYNMDLDQVKKEMSEETREGLRKSMIPAEVAEFLCSKATATDVMPEPPAEEHHHHDENCHCHDESCEETKEKQADE